VTLHKGTFIPEVPSDWGNNVSSAQKTEISQGIAEILYLDRGQLTYYFDLNGQKVLYSPDQSKINQREEKVVLLTKIDTVAWLYSGEPFRWLTITVSTIFYGFVITYRRRANTKTHSV
jgi:hypothetical protein